MNLRPAATSIWNWLGGETWDNKYHSPAPGQSHNKIALSCLLTTALALTLINFFGFGQTFNKLKFLHLPGEYRQFSYFIFWSGVRFLGFVIIPIISLKIFTPYKISDMGVSLKRGLTGWPVYLVLFVLMLPLLYAVSFLPSFLHTYPFHKPAINDLKHFFLWELVYAWQFFSIEFFFRGYMVHILKHTMGALAVPVMTVPYVMIHFQKPLPECLGAIVAGMILGMLSLKTGRIWGGFLVHVGVAVGMDILAIWRLSGG